MFIPNPYRPGAGIMPAYLAGRETMMQNADEIIQTVKYGFPIRSVIYYGLRGVGKTVLLNRLLDMAVTADVSTEYIEIEETGRSFREEAALHIYKLMEQLSLARHAESYAKRALGILKAFSLRYSSDGFSAEISVDPLRGISDTGNINNDLTELFLALGKCAQEQHRGVILFLDEIQYMKKEDMEALFLALHRVNQKGYPLVVIAAGLPKIIQIAGKVKSYAERLFSYIPIGALDKPAAYLALTKPAEQVGFTYTDSAAQEVYRVTEGYPYFIQEYGKWIWQKHKDENPISIHAVKAAYPDFTNSLDKAFFRSRYARATHRELEFMFAMVKCGKLPCTIAQVAKIMHTKVQSISVLRAQLIYKGLVYDPARGLLDFTVPQFDEYLKRTYSNALSTD